MKDILKRLEARFVQANVIKEVKRLIQRDDMLSGLEEGGVDNWDWYSESLKGYHKKYYPNEVDDEEA